MNKVEYLIKESIEVKSAILSSAELIRTIEQMAEICIEAFQEDKKMLFCGNGGSAADAQHIAAELSGRFKLERSPLFAEALHVNTSYLTAVANDYTFSDVYSRMVEAKGREGDILVAISTSGNSENILKAIEKAKAQKMTIIGWTGEPGGHMADICDILIKVPSTNTPRIQEAHILIGHILCELVESRLFA